MLGVRFASAAIRQRQHLYPLSELRMDRVSIAGRYAFMMSYEKSSMPNRYTSAGLML